MLKFLFRRRATEVPLLFRWRRPHWWSFRLVFVVLFSLFLHLAAFYAFETVYPPNRRQVLREGSVWILPPEDTACRALLAQHEERLRVFSAEADERAALSLDPIPIRFDSGSYQPQPMAWPPFAAGSTLVFPDALSGALPPPAPVPPEPAPGNVRTQVCLVWASPDAAMPVATGIDDPVPGEAGESLRGSVVVFHAGYDATGRVRHAVVLDGPGGPMVAPLRRAMLDAQVPGALPLPAPGRTAWAVVRMEFHAAVP